MVWLSDVPGASSALSGLMFSSGMPSADQMLLDLHAAYEQRRKSKTYRLELDLQFKREALCVCSICKHMPQVVLTSWRRIGLLFSYPRLQALALDRVLPLLSSREDVCAAVCCSSYNVSVGGERHRPHAPRQLDRLQAAARAVPKLEGVVF